ncbi:MAG: glycosyltransferase family 2 protein [Lachnospiraceae bacterium]|nr:glycosyltransferase family 2 protein [Lachnospiraceae bacterium]
MKKQQNRLVSIIVPVYNVEKYITETIACVQAQSYPDWELLLVEDGSSDRTVACIEELLERQRDERIRLILQKQNGGAARARNRGLQEAGGRYIAYLDADDLWVPDKLERELAFMEERKAAFVFTGYEFADEQGRGTGRVVRVPETLSYRQALQNTTIFTSTVLFDTELIAKEALEMPLIKSEDTALWWKVLRSGYVAYGLDENLVKYRRAGKSLSSNKLEAIRRIWHLYRRAEGLSVLVSAWNFCFWAVRAVRRRI